MQGEQTVGNTHNDTNNTPNTSEVNKTLENTPRSDEELEQELIRHLEFLFDLNNLKTNRYLIKFASINFEIPIHIIYEEKRIKDITMKKDLILQALKKVNNVEVIKGIFVKPKYEPIRNKIIVKQIDSTNEAKFITFLNELSEYKQAVPEDYTPKFDSKLNTITVECKDNAAAKTLFTFLNNTKFQENPIDVLLTEENLYITCLENLKTVKEYGYRSQPYSKFPQQYQGYNQNFMYGAGNYNPYVAQAMFSNSAYPNFMMNDYQGGMRGYNNNGYYKRNNYNSYDNYNSYGKKRFFDKQKSYNTGRMRNNRTDGFEGPKKNINFNQQEFPPLKNN